MKDISTVPGVDTATTNKPFGVPLDDSTPGDGLGMAVREDHYSDLYYGKIAVMDDVGIIPDNSEEGVTTSQFKDAIIEMSIKYGNPIGSILDHNPTYPNTPVLSAAWLKYYTLANGTTISDLESPYNGYRSPNYNGADVVLTGIVWASGVATIPATDVTALAIGDDVSGGSIALGTYISNIIGTTVTLTDTAISATVDTTFTNEGRFIRGGAVSGVGKKDQLQGFKLNIDFNNSASVFGSFAIAGASSSGTIATTATSPVNGFATDGVNGIPRVGSETRPIYTTAVKYFKKR